MIPKFVRRTVLAAAVFAASVIPSLPAGGDEKEGSRLSAAEFDKLHKLIKPSAGESRWMTASDGCGGTAVTTFAVFVTT